MRKLMIMLAILVVNSLFGAEILVLKNGKKITIENYEVKGQYVLIKGKNGEVHQLPSKIIDFDKSKAATEHENARLAEIEAEKNKPKKKPTKGNMTMAEIAEYVEGNRDADNPGKPGFTLGTSQLSKYSENNPRSTNSEAPWNPPESNSSSFEKKREDREDFGKRFGKLQEEINNMDAQIVDLTDRAERFEGELAAGYDDTGNVFRNAERLRKQAEDLKAKRAQKQQELDKVKTEARRAGVRNVERFTGKRDEPQPRSRKNRSREAKGKYKEGKEAKKFVDNQP
jgi:hypothetical protein